MADGPGEEEAAGVTPNADSLIQVGWWDNDEPEYAAADWHFVPLGSQGPHDHPVFIVTPNASSDYEGLYCAICGEESGNTDLCVSCALRVMRRDMGLPPNARSEL